MHRNPGEPPADTDEVEPRGHGPGRRSRRDLSTLRETLRELWRFKGYGRPERKSLALGVLMNGGQMAADLAAPWPLALVINDLLQGKGQGKGQGKSGVLHTVAGWFGGSSMAMLLVAAIAVLVISAAGGIFSYLADMYMNGSGQRITARIRADCFAYTQRLPLSFHDRQTVGELTSRVVSDTSTVESTLRDVCTDLFPSVLTLVGTATVMVAVDWRLGLIALVVAPLVFLTANHFAGLTRQYALRKRAATGGLTGFVTESLMGIRTVHAFGNQHVQDQQFAAQNDTVLSLSLRSVKVSAKFSPTLQMVAALGTSLVLFVGGYGALNGWWQVGVLVVMTSYLKNMLSPMKTLAKLAPSFTQGAASARRIADILDQPSDHQGTDEPLPDRVDGRIELRKVGLDYGTGRGPVFTDVDGTVTPGDRIALLGDNGAGKSTLLSVIGGLYRPTSGQVLLDGHSVPDVPEHWLHQQVAMVLQDTFLFSGTLADNIRYGRPDATDAEVAAAAEAALVSEFADDLPDGLDTPVATGGTGLSGGQRQRVGIARALLVDAPVVLLDEPTAGLDVHAEALVVEALSRLVEGRTIITTTHRPAVTALATGTVYLRQGGVLETELSQTAPADPSSDGTRLPPQEPSNDHHFEKHS